MADKFQTVGEALAEARSVAQELQRSFDTLGHARKRLITAWKRAGAHHHEQIDEIEAMLSIAHTSYRLALKKVAELEAEYTSK